LFLDEIADLSPHGQVALLRSIQQREIVRVGGEKPIPVDVRILAASNRSLEKLVEEGKFRADLYFRLNNITVSLPPLSERLDDLPLLAEDFLARLKVQLNKKFRGISLRFYEKLNRHHWPGNVRELQHTICQAALLENGPMLEGRHFLPVSQEISGEAPSLPPDAVTYRKSRHKTALQTLARCRGNKSEAAKVLGITRKTLYAWLESPE
jgi:two-component system response regulator HydG